MEKKIFSCPLCNGFGSYKCLRKYKCWKLVEAILMGCGLPGDLAAEIALEWKYGPKIRVWKKVCLCPPLDRLVED